MRNKLQSLVPAHLKIPVLLSLLLLLITTLIALSMLISLQPEIPIFYSLASPKEYLANKNWILAFPSISLVMFIANAYIMRLLNSSDRILQRIFAWTATTLQFFLFIAMIRVLILVL